MASWKPCIHASKIWMFFAIVSQRESIGLSLCENRESEDRAVSRMQWRHQEAFRIAACPLARQDWQHNSVRPITCRTGSSSGAYRLPEALDGSRFAVVGIEDCQ